MYILNTRHALFYSSLRSFKESINAIKKGVENSYKIFGIELEILKDEFNRQTFTSNYEELVYIEHQEEKRFELYESLNVTIAGLFIMLKSSFDTALRDGFSGCNIGDKQNNEPFYMPFFKYAESELNFNLSDDFYKTFRKYNKTRNTFSHTRVNLEKDTDEIRNIIKEMSHESYSFMKAVYDTRYSKKENLRIRNSLDRIN